jgi:hypothetical protein
LYALSLDRVAMAAASLGLAASAFIASPIFPGVMAAERSK